MKVLTLSHEEAEILVLPGSPTSSFAPLFPSPPICLSFLYALHFSCATDFSLSAQTDLYIAINCLLLGKGLLWTKQPGLTAGWTAIWSFTAGLFSPENVSARLTSSATTSHPQCHVFPNLSASLTLTICFCTPPWL